MTCFWDGIKAKLGPHIDRTFPDANPPITNHENFIAALKRVAAIIDPENVQANIQVNEEKITANNWAELRAWIAEYDVSKIGLGHDCSTCDPFLILLSQMLYVTIFHNYCGHMIVYKNAKERFQAHFSSDAGHFQ